MEHERLARRTQGDFPYVPSTSYETQSDLEAHRSSTHVVA